MSYILHQVKVVLLVRSTSIDYCDQSFIRRVIVKCGPLKCIIRKTIPNGFFLSTPFNIHFFNSQHSTSFSLSYSTLIHLLSSPMVFFFQQSTPPHFISYSYLNVGWEIELGVDNYWDFGSCNVF